MAHKPTEKAGPTPTHKAADEPAAVRRDPSSEIIVGFDEALLTKGYTAARAELEPVLKPLRDLGATVLDVFVSDPPEGKGLTPAGFAIIRLDGTEVTLDDLRKGLEETPTQFPGITYFEYNAGATVSATVFDDPLAPLQWALATLGADQGWSATPNGPVVVAIVDSGLRRPDSSIPEDIDSAKVMPLASCQSAGFYADGVDQYGHGTMLAGTIAAVPDNATGIASPVPATWNITLMPIKFFGPAAPPNLSDAAKAMHLAAGMAQVVTAAWHVSVTDGDKTTLRDAIKQVNQGGGLVVAAAGNDGTDNGVYPTYPANYGNPSYYSHLKVLTVAATGKDDFKASFSNYSPDLIDIAAPGTRIITTGAYLVPPARYPSYSGTSAAAAYVSAGAALVFARVAGLTPKWKPKDVQQYLKDSADKLPSLKLVCNDGNRLNLKRAVYGPLHVLTPVGGGTLFAGSTTSITWSNDFLTDKLSKVRVDFSKDGGTNWNKIDDNVGNGSLNGSLAWKPKNTDKTNTGLIRIAGKDGCFPALSGPFAVK